MKGRADINSNDMLFEPLIVAGEILWKKTDTNMEIPVLVRDIIDETGNYDEINCRAQDLRDGTNTVCIIKYNKSTRFQGCNQDTDEYIRKFKKNPKITESMLAEWIIAVHTANLLACCKIWRRCSFIDNFLPGWISDIQKGKKAAEIITKFRVQIENCVTNLKHAIKCFISFFAAVYAKSKCSKANITNLPEIDFNALGKVALCSICHKPSNVKLCAGSNCNKFFHVGCFQQSIKGKRLSRAARKSLNSGEVMCELCSITTKTTPQASQCLTCTIHDKCMQTTDLMHCIECDVSYHKHESCIPAGSQLMSAKQLLCPKHRNGKLCIKCDKGHRQAPKCRTCSNVCHKRCMTKSELGSPLEWQCNMCKTDVLTYNEVVYAKRKQGWWPARIVYDRKKTKCDECRVDYFGTDKYSICKISDLMLFAKVTVEEENNRSEPGKCPSLDKAIRLAYLHLKRNGLPHKR